MEGKIVSRKTILSLEANLFHKGEIVSHKTILCHGNLWKGEFVSQKSIFVLGEGYMPWEANLCHERLSCAMGGESVP